MHTIRCKYQIIMQSCKNRQPKMVHLSLQSSCNEKLNIVCPKRRMKLSFFNVIIENGNNESILKANCNEKLREHKNKNRKHSVHLCNVMLHTVCTKRKIDINSCLLYCNTEHNKN